MVMNKEDVHGDYRQPSNGQYFNGQPSKANIFIANRQQLFYHQLSNIKYKDIICIHICNSYPLYILSFNDNVCKILYHVIKAIYLLNLLTY